MRWSKDAFGERKIGRRRLHEVDPVAESPPRDGQHLGTLVEPGHAVAAGEQLLGDEACPGCDVEHRAAVARDA